jgi:tetratricopeptide (TPR) repeat protein
MPDLPRAGERPHSGQSHAQHFMVGSAFSIRRAVTQWPDAMRLFVSSPSDVAAERARVDAVAARLNGEFEGLTQIEVVCWETEFYTADRSFQEAIDMAIDRMHGTDIVVCVLWKRVGSELNPRIWRRPNGTVYESGTVLEVETAVEVARDQGGVPDVYLFKKRAPVTYTAEDYEAEAIQHQLLEAVWQRWTKTAEGHNVAGYQHFDDADHFERQLERCLRLWLERKGIVLRTVWDRRLKGPPFRGLEAFEAAHAPVFFGREPAIVRVIAKLRHAEEAGTAFLVVVGASGSGKSSLLRAGLVPRITRPGTIAGIDCWRTALVIPTSDPLVSLAEALFAETALGNELQVGDFGTPELLARCFAAGGEMAAIPIRAALDRAARCRAAALGYDGPRPVRLLIAVDQFERLFFETDPAKIDAFAEGLCSLIEQRLATVVVALRSDAYARFQKVAAFVALLEEQLGAIYNLLPPTQADLEDIVTKPVASCQPQLVFESDARGRSLAEKLVIDAQGGDALPLLQMTLQRLYEAEEKCGDGVLRFADYPGLGAAVADAANEALATLDAVAQAELPALLTALVGNITLDVSGSTQPMCIAPDRVAFERGLANRAALVDAFIARRLLTAEEVDGCVRIRPVHDALLRTWPEAVRIIAENAALIRVRHTLEPMVGDWASASNDAKRGHLLSSAALLAGAERLAARFTDDLPLAMTDFIATSLAADQARRGAERRSQRRALAVIASGLVAALLLAGAAGWQWWTAEAERGRAERSLAVATQAANGLVNDLSQKFRNFGIPAATIRGILDRVLQLQSQLLTGGETSSELRHSQARALLEVTATLLTLGDTKAASVTAKQAHVLWSALATSDHNEPEWQSGLAGSDFWMGNVLRAQGQLDPSLAAFRRSLAIRQELAKKEPSSFRWQSDVSVSEVKVGEVLASQGDLDAALAAYQEALSLPVAVKEKDPNYREWQHNLGVIHERIGDALMQKRRLDDALRAYRDSLAIAEKLSVADAGNTEWQRNLGFSYERIGNVLMAQGDWRAAVEPYQASFKIRQALAIKDSGNTEWQHDLGWAHEKIGDVFKAQGLPNDAIVAYRKSLRIRENLSKTDPDNIEWKADLVGSQIKVGDGLVAAGKSSIVDDSDQNSILIARETAARHPGQAETDLVERIQEGLRAQINAGPSGEVPVYKPPLRGAPGGRVGGASR